MPTDVVSQVAGSIVAVRSATGDLGIARMPQPAFQAITFLGSWPWCFGLACVGTVLGARWDSDPTLRDGLHRSDAVVAAMALAGVASLGWRRFSRRAT